MELFNNFKDITPVVKNQLCLSCGACEAVCPTNVISFYETAAGHVFPKIEYNECINCTLCLQVCPGVGFSEGLFNKLPYDPFIGNVQSVLVGKTTNKKRYDNSQSGGVVTELVYNALKSGEIGAVIVAEMQEQNIGNPRAKGIVVTNPEDLMKTQKSKYVPIPILTAIKEIENLNVDFGIVGISCHIHGIENLLEKKRRLKKKLKFKVGLICDRVMTYKGEDYLINKSLINGKVTEFIFRDKSYKGYPGDIKIKSKDELKYLPPTERMIIKDLFTPTRCRICFDKMNIFADITVGDPHKIEGVDNENGESLIISRTDIGSKLIDKARMNNSISIRKVKDDYTIGQGINEKRKKWHQYLKVLIDQDYILPNFIENVKNIENIDIDNTILKQIKYSNNLFKATEETKILNSIGVKLKILKLKNRSIALFYKVKEVIFN